MAEKNESEILLDVAVFGEQIDQFFKSDIGKFLLRRIEEETQEGLRELRNVDCNDARAVWSAQARVRRAEMIKTWLDEALRAGLKARDILEDRLD